MTAAKRHWAATHAGAVRTINEDAFLCRPEIGLFAVADGVGGNANGKLASAEVMRMLAAIPMTPKPAELLSAVRSQLHAAHDRLRSLSRGDGGPRPATTAVVLLLSGAHLTCLWVGDSRAYILRNGRITQLTTDHSVVGEMVRAGRLTDVQAARHPDGNVITRAIGGGAESVLLDKVIASVEPDDRLLLCSDGLFKALSEDRIATGVSSGPDPASSLLDAALSAGAKDNVTIIVTAIGKP
jgi:serine/threonine protein phosphatase PrpC